MTHEQLEKLKKDPEAYKLYRDKVNAYRRRPDVRERYKQYKKEYYEKNREKLLEKNRQRTKLNKEKYGVTNPQQLQYQKDNKDKINAYQRTRRKGPKSEEIKKYNRDYHRDYRKVDKNKRIESLEDKIRYLNNSDDRLKIKNLEERVIKLRKERNDNLIRYQMEKQKYKEWKEKYNNLKNNLIQYIEEDVV